jgi:hypothetical protein
VPTTHFRHGRNVRAGGLAPILFIAGGLLAQKPPVVPKTFGDDYAGSEMCQICHETISTAYSDEGERRSEGKMNAIPG